MSIQRVENSIDATPKKGPKLPQKRETSFEHEMSLHSSSALMHITTLEVGGITPLPRWENWGQHGWVPCPESYSLEVAAPRLEQGPVNSKPNVLFTTPPASLYS